MRVLLSMRATTLCWICWIVLSACRLVMSDSCNIDNNKTIKSLEQMNILRQWLSDYLEPESLDKLFTLHKCGEHTFTPINYIAMPSLSAFKTPKENLMDYATDYHNREKQKGPQWAKTTKKTEGCEPGLTWLQTNGTFLGDEICLEKGKVLVYINVYVVNGYSQPKDGDLLQSHFCGIGIQEIIIAKDGPFLHWEYCQDLELA